MLSSARRNTASLSRLLILATIAAGYLMLCSASPAAAAKAQPKTVFQCEKAYKGRNARALHECIKRVKNEKPGTNCQHPLVSGTNGFDQMGHHTEFTAQLGGIQINLGEGEEEELYPEVTVHDPRIVLCPTVELRVWVRLPSEEFGAGKLHIYHLRISPHGGRGEAVMTAMNHYLLLAFGRYK